jgi:hypothetical protein
MSLHERSRELLFKEFLTRNYQGVAPQTWKEISSIRPEDILKNKRDKEHLSKLQKNFAAFLKASSGKTKAQTAGSVVQAISESFKTPFILLYELTESFSLTASKGVTAKNLKVLKLTPSVQTALVKYFTANRGALKSEHHDVLSQLSAEFFHSLASPLFFPFFLNNAFKGFVLVEGSESRITEAEAHQDFISNLLEVMMLHQDKEDGELHLKEKIKRSERTQKIGRHLMAALQGDVYADSSGIQKVLAKLAIKKCLLFQRNGARLSLLRAYGFPKAPESLEIEATAELVRTHFLTKETAAFFMQAVGLKAPSARVFACHLKKLKDKVIFLCDFPASMKGDTETMTTYAFQIGSLLSRDFASESGRTSSAQ